MAELDSPSTVPNSPRPDTTRSRTLLLIHGRELKPDAAALRELWVDALRHGLQRDHRKTDAPVRFDALHVEFVHYGDLLPPLLPRSAARFDPVLDLSDRRVAFEALKEVSRKKFRRVSYEALPGKTALKEFIADVGAPLALATGLSDALFRRFVPDIHAYLRGDPTFADAVRERIRAPLLRAFDRGDDIMVMAHCLGSVAAFDVFWELSRGEQASHHFGHKVSHFVSFGSPLADEWVKRHLKGHGASGRERFPANLLRWSNLAAEDDYCCHDETVGNDFRAMQRERLISDIHDYRIYNLAVRYGRSNPHSALGYLVHPRMASILAHWLTQEG